MTSPNGPGPALLLPRVFRTSAFRLTLLFLALFAAAAALFLAYVFVATAGQAARSAEAVVGRELGGLEAIDAQKGVGALEAEVQARSLARTSFFYLLQAPDGRRLAGDLPAPPLTGAAAAAGAGGFEVRPRPGALRYGYGREARLASGALLFVGIDVGEERSFVMGIARSSVGAGVLVLILGLAGGLLVSRNVSRSLAELTLVLQRVEGGDLGARAPLRGVADEYDEMAATLNAMLDRLEGLVGGLRHAGDAIAHDLRSPLTRLRARLEAAMIAVDAGREDPSAALAQALDDSDQVLKTFSAVLAISRLEAAGASGDLEVLEAADLVRGVCDLYAPLCEEKDLSLSEDLGAGLRVRAHREFLAQALANLLDNAVKYVPAGGAVAVRARRRSSGEVEISVTDTGPGVPEEDRPRIVERFVRLEASRNQPGAGLGLSLVGAVAEAHGGRLELSEGPGPGAGSGPGLRVAVILPPAP